MSSMREARLWRLLETSTKRTETFESIVEIMDFINNGISSMLMNGRENQERESSMRSSDFTLKDHSTLFLNYQTTDILI
jgi:hypothetical protein